MTPREPQKQFHTQLYRPLCSRCGVLSVLVRSEPSCEPGHDLRVFECPSCGQFDTVTMKLR